MRSFEKFYSVFYLLAGWFAVRFLLSQMYQWADLLAFFGIILVVVSLMKKWYSLARMSSVGYIVSYLISSLFEKKGVDAGGGATSNMWLIWTAIYIFLIALGAYIEKQRRKRYNITSDKKVGK